MPKKYDFSGYVTKADLRCSDGRRIRQNAFADQDGKKVPLVWQHRRDEPENVIGNVLLENKADGVYGYCSLNNSPKAQAARELVEHGDITAMSIYANKLRQNGSDVIHGAIREVSLVYAGANPGALIDNLSVIHSDGDLETFDDEADIYTGLNFELYHEDSSDDKKDDKDSEADGDTMEEIFNSMNDQQKNLVYALVGTMASSASGEAEHQDDSPDEEDEDVEHNESEEDDTMKKNVFDEAHKNDTPSGSKYELTHADFEEAVKQAQKGGSLKDALENVALQHGIENLEILFPEAQAISRTPDMITRENSWVSKVWNAIRKTPFSRVKSMSADLTKDEARAKGYIKGKKKLEEQFALLKRVTYPQTIYKKQGMDRDDIIDITTMDVVAWLKAEMRMMLNEELARAVMISDGRTAGAEDKINESNIRPIWKDDPMYTIYQQVTMAGADETDKANAIIEAALRARKNYRGSGSPTFYVGSDTLITMMLARDKIGRRLYNTEAELAAALRVSGIVEIPQFDGQVRTDEDTSSSYDLLGIIVNLTDYVIGADRGGAVSMFDDFDIDYNRYKYLIETRCSGALVKPYSAIVLETAHTENAAG